MTGIFEPPARGSHDLVLLQPVTFALGMSHSTQDNLPSWARDPEHVKVDTHMPTSQEWTAIWEDANQESQQQQAQQQERQPGQQATVDGQLLEPAPGGLLGRAFSTALTLMCFFFVIGLEIIQSWLVFSSWFCYKCGKTLDDAAPGEGMQGQQTAAAASGVKDDRDCKYYCRHFVRAIVLLTWAAFVIFSVALRCAEILVIEALAVVGAVVCAPLALNFAFGQQTWGRIRTVGHRTRLTLGHRCRGEENPNGPDDAEAGGAGGLSNGGGGGGGGADDQAPLEWAPVEDGSAAAPPQPPLADGAGGGAILATATATSDLSGGAIPVAVATPVPAGSNDGEEMPSWLTEGNKV
jgi:hypothetical protein